MSNQELATDLNDVATKLAELDEVNDKLLVAKSDLKSTQASLEQVKKDLLAAQDGLSAQQKNNVVAYEETIRGKYKELDEIKRRTDEAKLQYDSVSNDLKVSQTRHEQIEASLKALRLKFG